MNDPLRSLEVPLSTRKRNNKKYISSTNDSPEPLPVLLFLVPSVHFNRTEGFIFFSHFMQEVEILWVTSHLNTLYSGNFLSLSLQTK